MFVTSWPDNPPFPAAILQSEQSIIAERGYFAINSMDSWVRLAEVLNCTDGVRMGTGSELDCVKAANASTIKDIVEVSILEFQQVIDSITVFADPTQRRLANDIANAPILLGITGQQGRIYSFGQSNASQYINATFPELPEIQEQLKKAYTVGKDGLRNDYEVISTITTDFIYTCVSPPTQIFSVIPFSGVPSTHGSQPG